MLSFLYNQPFQVIYLPKKTLTFKEKLKAGEKIDDLKFINRDRVIRRIVSIVHNGKIKFVEGFHSNYKNLEEKYIKII